MMSKLITVAVVLGLSSQSAAEVFKWVKNNDFSNPSNWVAGVVPTGAVDFTNGCIEKFGDEGATILMDTDSDVGSIDIPVNMEIVFEDGVEIGITGEDANSGEWRCKDANEYLTTCSDNFMVKSDQGQWEAAETAPCYSDTIQFGTAAHTSVIWGSGQYIKNIQWIDGGDVVVSTIGSIADYPTDPSAMFQGPTPKIDDASCRTNQGQVTCQMVCIDECPERDLAIAVQDRDDFFALPEDTRNKVIEDVRTNQDAINSLRFDATEAMQAGRAKLIDATTGLQSEYDYAMSVANFTSSQDGGDVTIPSLKITAAQMANWMEGEGVGSAHAVHYVRHSLTKDNAKKTVDFFTGIRNGAHYYGVAEEPDTYSVMKLDSDLWTAIDTKGFVRDGGRKRRALYQSVSAFIMADANNILATMTGATATTIISFVGPVAVAADDSLDFPTAAGGFLITDVVVRNSVSYVDTDGNFVSGVSPEIIQLAIATSMTRMALFTRAEALRRAIHFRPTTTISPTMSPTMSPTVTPTAFPSMSPTFSPTASADFLAANLIPIAAGGGGALLLIVLIVVICVVVFAGGSKDKGSQDGDRKNDRAVAFENPMYDDPKHMESDTDADGLYDEPTFEGKDAGKENPMYTSNEDVAKEEDVAGGYLDVEPDDADDDDEEDEEEEEQQPPRQAEEVQDEQHDDDEEEEEEDDDEEEEEEEDDEEDEEDDE